MWPNGREERRRVRRAICAALAASGPLVATMAVAAPRPGTGERSGLLLRSPGEPADWSPAPEVATSIAVRVTGIVARTRVEQRFVNPGDRPVEARYLFPLPDGAAVDTMEMRIGSRRILGEVREREEARRTYERARSEGRKSSLLEQRRANVYSASVSGIEPFEEIVVRIEYQELVRYDSGRFRLRVPLTVGPRYEPAPAAPLARLAAYGGGVPDLANAALAPEPVELLAVGRGAVDRPVTFKLDLDAGVPLAGLESPTHHLSARREGDTLWHVELGDAVVQADRDLEVAWRPDRRRRPRVARFEEEVGGERYVALLVVPPAPELPSMPLARELILVLDTSGSMAGPSLEQAKRAVLFALRQMQPFDRFNLIRFASSPEALFDGAVEAGPAALGAARRFVEGLEAGGGTEMLPALDLALGGPVDPTVVRQVLFVTDGCVGNEQQLFAFLERRLGGNRLFTVGIGSAPNALFMRGAAELGRGTSTTIASPDEIEARMGELLAKLERPVLADLELEWDDPTAEAYPERPGDLYAGEPLLVLARLDRADATAHVTGRLAEAPWELDVPSTAPLSARGIARLWAQRKIAGIEGAMRRNEGDPDTLRAAVVELGIAHRIATRFTSFVAVEQTPSLPAGAPPEGRDVATLLPAGWSGGDLPQGGTRAPLELGAALAALAAALVLSRIGGHASAGARVRG